MGNPDAAPHSAVPVLCVKAEEHPVGVYRLKVEYREPPLSPDEPVVLAVHGLADHHHERLRVALHLHVTRQTTYEDLLQYVREEAQSILGAAA